MSDVNSVTLSGRLTKDPELRQTKSGAQVASFRLANNLAKKTNFFDVSLWGRSAETLSQYGGKGSWISVTGRLEQEEWEDREGNKRTSYRVSTENFNFLGGGNKSDGEEGAVATGAGAGAEAQTLEDSGVPF